MTRLGEIGVYGEKQTFAWRGMSSVDYPLSSSLHRMLGLDASESGLRAEELRELEDARNWGLGVGRFGTVDDLQLLADLQHYGIPTRLIDFTSNPMTALWFACQEPRGRDVSRDGIVLALNVTSWPVRRSGDMPLTRAGFEEPWANTLAQALRRGPFLVKAVEPNPRISAQEGFFAASAVPTHVSSQDAFQSLRIEFEPLQRKLAFPLTPRSEGNPPGLPFVAVVIKAHLKRELLSHLAGTYNRSAQSLFPDYAGFREFGRASGSAEPSAARR